MAGVGARGDAGDVWGGVVIHLVLVLNVKLQTFFIFFSFKLWLFWDEGFFSFSQ